jgi:hypothetical protein
VAYYFYGGVAMNDIIGSVLFILIMPLLAFFLVYFTVKWVAAAFINIIFGLFSSSREGERR